MGKDGLPEVHALLAEEKDLFEGGEPREGIA